MVYETISKGLDYICHNTGKALATGALVIMPLVGIAGCKIVQDKAPAVQVDERSFLDFYKKRAESYNKDKVINQDEVSDILADRAAVKSFREGLKGDDKVTVTMRDEATSIEG